MSTVIHVSVFACAVSEQIHGDDSWPCLLERTKAVR